MKEGILLKKLRAATSEKHVALEKVMMGTEQRTQEERYKMLLNTNLIFFDTLLGAPGRSEALGERLSVLVSAIERDFEEMMVVPRRAEFGFEPGHPGALYGIRYVVEGSSMGNKVMLHQLKSLPWAKSLAFHFLNKADTHRWQGFKKTLDHIAETDHPAVVSGGVRGFDLFSKIALWYQPEFD